MVLTLTLTLTWDCINTRKLQYFPPTNVGDSKIPVWVQAVQIDLMQRPHTWTRDHTRRRTTKHVVARVHAWSSVCPSDHEQVCFLLEYECITRWNGVFSSIISDCLEILYHLADRTRVFFQQMKILKSQVDLHSTKPTTRYFVVSFTVSTKTIRNKINIHVQTNTESVQCLSKN